MKKGTRLHKTEKDPTIHVLDLERGQLAIITNNENSTTYIGSVVQLIGGDLYILGVDDFFSEVGKRISRDKDFRVRVLEKGELIEVL